MDNRTECHSIAPTCRQIGHFDRRITFRNFFTPLQEILAGRSHFACIASIQRQRIVHITAIVIVILFQIQRLQFQSRALLIFGRFDLCRFGGRCDTRWEQLYRWFCVRQRRFLRIFCIILWIQCVGNTLGGFWWLWRFSICVEWFWCQFSFIHSRSCICMAKIRCECSAREYRIRMGSSDIVRFRFVRHHRCRQFWRHIIDHWICMGLCRCTRHRLLCVKHSWCLQWCRRRVSFEFRIIWILGQRRWIFRQRWNCIERKEIRIRIERGTFKSSTHRSWASVTPIRSNYLSIVLVGR